jgi:hypothetical protein
MVLAPSTVRINSRADPTRDLKLKQREGREMDSIRIMSRILSVAAAAVVAMGTTANVANATAPCGDFGECKVLIEINATDGDIGFHFLMDGDDLNSARIHDPNGEKVFEDYARGPMKDQKLTETFAESAEPVCKEGLKEDEDDVVVTLEEFVERWAAGTYDFTGMGDEGEKSEGETTLSHDIPAAPADVDFDGNTGVISWSDTGDDLGECATSAELDALVADGVLTTHPKDVEVAVWEAVFEPDVDDDDPNKNLKFSIRVPAGQLSVTVPAELLDSLPDDTPAKVEVGAIAADDNATFSELGDLCVNEDEGCDQEE